MKPIDNDKADKQLLRAAGISDFLAKPFEPATLFAVVLKGLTRVAHEAP